MSRSPRQIHLAAHFPGVNSTTVWTDPASGSQIDFAAFEYFARTAERGFFDYVFLAEGLRLREHKGRVHELDVLGRPNTLAILAALTAVVLALRDTGEVEEAPDQGRSWLRRALLRLGPTPGPGSWRRSVR